MNSEKITSTLDSVRYVMVDEGFTSGCEKQWKKSTHPSETEFHRVDA